MYENTDGGLCMRYYHYGYMVPDGAEVKKADTFSVDKNQRIKKRNNTDNKMYEGLVIEDDTVYEIDEECVNCRKNNI